MWSPNDDVEDETQRLLQAERRCLSRDAEFVKHRHILVDWMDDVRLEFDHADETLFLAVNYLDRILGDTPVRKTEWQLVALTCMLIAGSYTVFLCSSCQFV
jgi:hypothetical protein